MQATVEPKKEAIPKKHITLKELVWIVAKKERKTRKFIIRQEEGITLADVIDYLDGKQVTGRNRDGRLYFRVPHLGIEPPLEIEVYKETMRVYGLGCLRLEFRGDKVTKFYEESFREYKKRMDAPSFSQSRR